MANRLQNTRETIDRCVSDKEITRNDVLLGRGAASDRFEGNVHFRTLVRAHKDEYSSSMHPQGKAFIAQQIVQTIQANQGRFLRKIKLPDERVQDIDSTMWEIVSDSVAIEKVKQAFRDMDHRVSISHQEPEMILPNTPSASPLNAPPRLTTSNSLFRHSPMPTTGLHASIHPLVNHGNDLTFTAHQSSRVQIQSESLPPASSASSPLANVLDDSRSNAESENQAMVLLASLATNHLFGNNATVTPRPTATFPGTVSNATTTTNATNPFHPRASWLHQLTDPNNGFSTHLNDRLPPSFLQTSVPQMPTASSLSILDLPSLAPDLLQRLSQQVAYRDFSHALVAPPQINLYTAAPTTLPTALATAATSPGVDWNRLLVGSSPRLLYQDILHSLVSPPSNPSTRPSLLAAAVTSPATISLPNTSALFNVEWEQIPGHYLSHLPLVHSGRLGPFTRNDWHVIRIVLARAEAAQNGSVLIQISAVLRTIFALPPHQVDLHREDILAMGGALQRLTVLLSASGTL
jgi:hypothetical protein